MHFLCSGKGGGMHLPESSVRLWECLFPREVGANLSGRTFYAFCQRKHFYISWFPLEAITRSLPELKEYCYSFHMACTLMLNYLSLEAPADIFLVIKYNKTQKWVSSSWTMNFILCNKCKWRPITHWMHMIGEWGRREKRSRESHSCFGSAAWSFAYFCVTT